VDYDAAIGYLLSLSDMERGYQAQASRDPVMSLASMRSLLERLGNPQSGRPTVHITGSKGKGSTAAMITSILRQAGRNPALFTSPHLHDYTERIAIGDGPVSREEFAAGLTAIQPVIEAERASGEGDISTFGALTALFFWLARAQVRRVDWQVVEVGLGGTFDTTNVFDEIEVAVITPISLEHTKILGDTTTAIARDKAGIIKPGSTCVLARQDDPEVIEVVRQRCEEVGATLVYVPDHYEAEPRERHVYGQSFEVHGRGRTLELRTLLLGRHQVENAATAVAVIDALRERGHTFDDHAIADGLGRTRLHGRMEVMGQRPLIVADGAHNDASARALAETLKHDLTWQRCFLIIGVNEDKNVRAMGFILTRLAELVIATKFDNPRALDPYVIIQEIGFLGTATVAEPDIASAMETALSHATQDDLICITGSLYLVAEARELLLGEAAHSR
jgi:dihydrofolate synthase/folylpolyglutamate synthase